MVGVDAEVDVEVDVEAGVDVDFDVDVDVIVDVDADADVNGQGQYWDDDDMYDLHFTFHTSLDCSFITPASSSVDSPCA